MRPNTKQHTIHRRVRCSSVPLIYSAAIVLMIWTSVRARLTPEDIAAITETGLTTLTAEQGGGEYPVKDYVVVETMRIPRGDTVTFKGGSRILFHPNARITVFGTLQFLGTARKKITLGKLPFTLPKLSGDKKNVYDTTSIFAYRQSQLTMKHTVMADPSIKIRLTDTTSYFTLDTVTCADNHFLLPDTAFFFPVKSTVTCKLEPDVPFIPCKPVLADTTTASGRTRFAFPVRLSLQIGLGAGIIGAGGVWYYYNQKADKADRDYNNARSPDDCDRQTELNHTALLYRNLATVAAMCGLAGLSLTIVFGGGHQR